MLKLNESIEQLHQKSMSARKESEVFLQALREWALIEDLHSKSLERLSNHTGLTKGSANYLSNITNYIISLSQRSKKLSEHLSHYIVGHFKDLLTTQSHLVKNNYLEGKKLEEYITRKLKHTIESMKKYLNSCRVCEQVAFDLDKESSQQKKEKIFQKMLGMKKEADLNLELYKKAVNSYNVSISQFRSSMDKVLEAYTFYEEKRCKCFEESVETLHKFLADQPEIPLATAKIKPQPTKFDSNLFILEELSIEQYEGDHPLFQGTGRGGFHFSVLETSGVAQGTLIAVEELYRNEITDIIQKAWQGEELTSEDYMKLNMRLKDPLGRKAWSWSMNLRRAEGNFKISSTGYNKIGELMLAALNECERTKDITIAKNCIILSQTFYKNTEQGEKLFLQAYIIDHSIWKNTEFWENAVNSAIVEELKKQVGDVDGLEDISNEKNLVFCQLVSFGHIMMSFQFSLLAARDFVNKYAKKYSFSEEEVESIMSAVHDSLQVD